MVSSLFLLQLGLSWGGFGETEGDWEDNTTLFGPLGGFL